MHSRLKEQLTYAAIRRLMRTILGTRKRGLVAGSGDARLDPVQILSGAGGFHACFPDLMTWQQFYMRGMADCPYVDAFWRASHDVGLAFTFAGVFGFDEEQECFLSTEQTFQQLGERIHFHWACSELSASDKYQHLPDRAMEQPFKSSVFPIAGVFPVIGSVLLAASMGFMDREQALGLGR